MAPIESRTSYVPALILRYLPKDKLMDGNFSANSKFIGWHDCWIALAEAQKELGITQISDAAIAEMKAKRAEIDYETARNLEKELRHDVMAHAKAYGRQCPSAEGIIHLGATSCCITDNAELVQYFYALDITRRRLVSTINKIAETAKIYKDRPCLGLTHLQPAQLITAGKRIIGWASSLLDDYNEIMHIISNYRLRGLKGATGTQDSYLTLFDGDESEVVELEKRFVQKLSAAASSHTKRDVQFGIFPITTQTYDRKFDLKILSVLAGIGISCYKMGSDIRHWQSMKEVEEPSEESQIGSSAMAYKRNPMRSERMCSLAAGCMADSQRAAFTAATQWMERTLDDSAARRDYMPEAFLRVEAALNLAGNIVPGIVVYPYMMKLNIDREFPFMLTEKILMEAVKKGANRQELHEVIRQHSLDVAKRMKTVGAPNNLLDLLADDPKILLARQEIDAIADPSRAIGRCVSMIDGFVKDYVEPILAANPDYKTLDAVVDV